MGSYLKCPSVDRRVRIKWSVVPASEARGESASTPARPEASRVGVRMVEKWCQYDT